MSNNRIFTYYNEARSLICGDIPVPRMAILYPVYGCNLFCKNCLCKGFNDHSVFMDWDSFKRTTIELKLVGIKSIELCGGGEPLIHPQKLEMISWITNKLHLFLGVITNGLSLDDELAYLLVTRATYIRVSIYLNVFDLVFEKIQRLIETKKLTGSNVKIGAKFLVSNRNMVHINEKCRILLAAGVDHISLKAERNSSYELTLEEAMQVTKEIHELNSPLININLTKTYLKERCWLSPIHTLIDPLGDMFICCYYMGRENRHKIGNIFESSFASIWGSERHKQLLQNIDIQECNVYDCRWHNYNNEMKQLFETTELQYNFC